MTLTKRLSIGAMVFLLVIFTGTYLVSLHTARNYFIKQLESNAQDTATSLGLSLSQSFKKNDMPTMLAMVQAVFDRGYFDRIEVRNIAGKLLILRKKRVDENIAPQWFINLIELPSKPQQALVMSGWQQVGTVLVSSDRAIAYQALWKNAVWLFQWYILFVIITLILVYLFIQSLLRPLKRVEKQAIAISEQEFPIETQIPKAPELRHLTLTMNQMVLKVKSLFAEHLNQTEKLRQQVYLDPLTELSNRRYFLQQLHSLLDNEDEFIPGYVVMLVLEGLDEYNHQHGFQKGDELIQSIAEICKKYWQYPTTVTVARIRGNSFAVIDHELDADKFAKKCREFELGLSQFFSQIETCEFYMAAIPYFFHQTPSNLLSLLDTAIKKSIETGVPYTHTVHDQVVFPKQLKSDDILLSIEQKRVSLHWQAVKGVEKTFHHEVFVRLSIDEIDEIGAGYFMPIAQEHRIAYLIDLYVLLEVVKVIIHSDETIALNLSRDTLVNNDNADNYLKELNKIPETIRQRIYLEIGEEMVVDHFPAIKAFIMKARKQRIKIGIDRVGMHFASMHYFSELPITYVKLHGSLIQDIEENETKQFFIHHLALTLKTLDIEVIATQVEYEAQWKALQFINVTLGQGRFLSEVNPVEIPGSDAAI